MRLTSLSIKKASEVELHVLGRSRISQLP
uniref:Uncharacterized protein n=1 Tax=Anguilla anguilla TaxID=7936 RepID=A0A0E9PDD4_ANGAN